MAVFFPVIQISYIIFLGIFSFFLLTELHPDSIGPCEILVWIWCLTLVIEEGRQVDMEYNLKLCSPRYESYNMHRK